MNNYPIKKNNAIFTIQNVPYLDPYFLIIWDTLYYICMLAVHMMPSIDSVLTMYLIKT